MRPLDAVTGLPRSHEVAKVADALAKQAEAQVHAQGASFSREIAARSQHVVQPAKVEGRNVDTQSPGGSGGGYQLPPKGQEKGQTEEPEVSAPHPTKGKVLDIRGT